MTNRIQRGDLQVSEELDKLISEKVCVNIDVEPEQFWNSFNEVVKEFTPRTVSYTHLTLPTIRWG